MKTINVELIRYLDCKACRQRTGKAGSSLEYCMKMLLCAASTWLPLISGFDSLLISFPDADTAQ